MIINTVKVGQHDAERESTKRALERRRQLVRFLHGVSEIDVTHHNVFITAAYRSPDIASLIILQLQ